MADSPLSARQSSVEYGADRESVEQRVSRLPARDCPASMEAVYEHGDVGCPICGKDALDHILECDREVLR